jgi:recombinational DNA repair protein RecR
MGGEMTKQCKGCNITMSWREEDYCMLCLPRRITELESLLKDCSDKFDQLTDMYNDLQFAIRFVISLVQDVTEGRMTVDELRKYKEQAEKKEITH